MRRRRETNFYFIQTMPDVYPSRIKMGIADSVEGRLAGHRTTTPTAELLGAWPCFRTWEVPMMERLGAYGRHIRGEVYDFDDPKGIAAYADKVFAVLAPLVKREPGPVQSSYGLIFEPLSNAERAVLSVIAGGCGERGWCAPSYGEIAAAAGIATGAPDKTKLIIERLIEIGYLRLDGRFGGCHIIRLVEWGE